jgi:hypothetical protein
MKKFVAIAAVVTAVSFSAVSAQAGGWGYNGQNTYSSGLINVSPSLKTGNIGVLNGLGVGILNGSPIASGNVVQGILSGNDVLGGNGVLNGNSTGILGIGTNLLKGGKRH